MIRMSDDKDAMHRRNLKRNKNVTAKRVCYKRDVQLFQSGVFECLMGCSKRGVHKRSYSDARLTSAASAALMRLRNSRRDSRLFSVLAKSIARKLKHQQLCLDVTAAFYAQSRWRVPAKERTDDERESENSPCSLSMAITSLIFFSSSRACLSL